MRGAIAINVAATSFALTPSSTPVGEVILHVAFADGAAIDPAAPAVTGGGGAITWAHIPPIGNETSLGANSRKFYLFWGHGTFDGSAITVTPAAGATIDECEIQLLDWANTSATKPITHVYWTPLLVGNGITCDSYQQKRIGSNNVLGIFAMNGGNAQTHVWSEGTILGQLNTGSILTVSSGWHNADFTNFKFTHSGFASSSSGAFMYEVQASDSDDGPTANCRPIANWIDASGDITTGTFTPKANEVIVFATVTNKTADSTDFITVRDGSLNDYTKIAAVNIDADHRLHVWAFRYGASPPVGTAITGDYTGTLVGSVGSIVGLLKENGTALPGSTNIDWLVQAVTAIATGTSVTATIPSIAQHSSVLAFGGRDTEIEDWTFEQGWIPMMKPRDDIAGNGASASDPECIMVSWLGGNEDNTATLSCSSGDLGIIAIEVA